MKIVMKATLRGAFTGACLGMIPVLQVSFAQQVVDPAAAAAHRATIRKSLNGTAVQDIAAPNAAGLSHNKFSTFNVDTKGLVINNSSVNAVSQIGGAVVANPNLSAAQARLILNEVTSGSRSILQGPQELLGGRAGYILANPNGITCDGCGFINFPRVTLTTGAPTFAGGDLAGFAVNKGDVLIGPGGMNATGADYFDIITRSVTLAGQANAANLSMVLGRNQVDYATLAATPLAPDGSDKPAFALDSSALGGMYAGRISLVATEAGVGVRALGNVAATVDDVTLQANGRIELKDNTVTAARNVLIRSTQLASAAGAEIDLSGAKVYAAADTLLEGGDVALAGGQTGAGRDLRITAASYADSGAGTRAAARDLVLDASGAATVDGSTLLAQRNLAATAASLALRNGAVVLGESDQAGADGLGTTQVSVTGALTLQDAALQSGGALAVQAGSVSVDQASNDGGAQGLRGLGNVTIDTGSLDNAGLVASNGTLDINASGTVTNLSTGLLQAATVDVSAVTLANAGDIGATGAMTLRASKLTNQDGGSLLANGGISLAGTGGSSLFTNEEGAQVKGQSLAANFAAIDNSGLLYGASSLALTAGGLTNRAGGTLSTPGSLVLQQTGAGGSFGNAGTAEGGTLAATWDTLNNSTGGRIFGDASATLTVKNLTNDAQLSSDGTLTLNADAARGTKLVNNGSMDAAALSAYFGTIENHGTMFASSALTAGATSFSNDNMVSSDGSLTLRALDVANRSTASRAATLYAIGDLSIGDNHTLNNESAAGQVARIVSRDGKLTIDSRSGNASTQSVTNSGGLLFSGGDLRLLVSRQFINQNWVGMRAYTFSNTGNMLLGAESVAALLDPLSQQLTIRNVDSDIEARTGSITINTSVLENTTTDTAPVKETVYLGRRNYGLFDYDGTLDGSGDLIQVYDNCAQYVDHFDKDRQGHRCAAFVDSWEERFTGSPNTGPRARLIAGANLSLYIENSALNYISLMSAGQDVDITGTASATFTNRSETLRYEEAATVYRYDDGGVTHNPAGDCYTGTSYNRCYHDGLDHRKQFTNISLSFRPGKDNQGISATVQAGGTINVHGIQSVDNGVRGNTAAAPSDRPAGSGATDPGAAGSVGSQTITTGLPGAIGSLASSPFFQPAANPTSPFLFETDPRLMSLSGLYGSDLFLNSLGMDPAKYLRAGDPYFEQQLLRQQLLAQAGQLFIADGLAGENEQFKLLMENAVAAKGALQLRVGVALTAEQVANLQKDIVWMVETVVQGKKVLVPQLYLSDATRAKLADGAKFVASNIQVKTEGAITNSGAFVASKDMSIDAGTTFTNRLGTLVAANGLSIAATGDILNQSGTIRGGDVSLESRTGSVVNETLTKDVTVHGSQGSGTNTIVGATATIESTGSLNIKAAQDIVSKGGDVKAGGNATLDAGRDITFTGIEVKNLSSSQSSGQVNGYNTYNNESTQSTSIRGSGLVVGGDLSATAKRDINVEASSVDVAGGGRIDAGRNINITAVGETSSSRSESRSETWNSKSSEVTTVEQTIGKASTLNFGGSLAIASGGDTNIKGSDLAVGGDLNVEKIGGNLNISTFENTTKVDSTTKQSSFFGGKAEANPGQSPSQAKASASATLYSNQEERTQIDSMKNRGSGISVGGNLNAGEGAIKGDVNIKGSDIAAGGDMNLAAGGSMNILAAEDRTTVTQSSKGTSVSLGADASIDGAGVSLGVQHNESTGSATQTTARVSSLSSGGNMSLTAKGDFTEQGTQVAAGGDLKVDARSINSLAAQDTYTETGDSKSVSVSLGIKAETGLGAVVDSFVDKKGKADFDMAAASQSLGGLDKPDAGSVKAELNISTTQTTRSGSGTAARTSSFTSGGNTSFRAREGDATFQGTSVQAGGSIDVAADKGNVKILAAESRDTASSSTTKADVSIGVSLDGTISGSGSGSKESESSSSTRQTAASFTAGKDLNITAKNDVTLVGTNLAAGGTAGITATEGKIDFQAARDTSSSTSASESANASFSANISGKEGSIGGGGGTSNTSESSSTGRAGSITAGNVVLKSKGDIALEGTNVQAKDSATLETQGKVDFKAVESTYTRTATGTSAQVDLEAGATGGGAKVGASKTDEFEQSSTKTGGSLSAANLTIKAGSGVRLEGTQVDVSKDASIDAGSGKLVLESAVSTSTKRVNNTAVEVGAKGDAKSGSGQGSAKVEGAYEDTQKTTNQNASLNIGGKADLKAAGGIDVKGSNVTGVDSVVRAGELNTNGAAVSVEQRQDVDRSSRRDVDVSVGVNVPSRKARQEVADVARKVRDSDAANTVRNKVENLKASVSNAADTVATKMRNAAEDVRTAAKNVGADDATRKANVDAARATKDANNQKLADTIQQTKDTATANKLANNSAQADRKATAAETRITAEQSKKDQKADYDRQKADDRAAAERDRALKQVDATAPDADQKKAQIEAAFETKKQANAETAERVKQDNAIAALDQRSAYADKTADRKVAAEDKAAASQVRHADTSGEVKVALAEKRSDSTRRTEAETARIDKVGQTQAEQAARQKDVAAQRDQAKAENEAKKQRITDDRQAQEEARRAAEQARTEQATADRRVDADSSLSDADKKAKKEDNAKAAADKIKQADQQLADKKAANADKEAQAISKAATAADETRAEGEKARQERLAQAEVDRLAVAPAQALVDAQRKADRQLEQSKAEAARQRDEAKQQAKGERDEAVAEARKKKDDQLRAIDADKNKKPEDKRKEREKAEQEFADKQRAADDKLATQNTTADDTHKQKVADAEKARREDADVRDATVAKAKAETELVELKQARTEQAAQDLASARKVAQLGEAQRQKVADAEKAKAQADQAVRDGSLDPKAKADKLRENARTLADAKKAAEADYLAKRDAEQGKRETDAKAAEKAAVDKMPLSDSEKADKRKEIDDKYQARADERAKDKKAREQAAETAHKEALAEADRAHKVATVDATHQAKADELQTQLDSDLAELERKKQADLANIPRVLAPEDRERRKKEVEQRYAEQGSERRLQRDTELADATRTRDADRAAADRDHAKQAARDTHQRELDELRAQSLPQAEHDQRKADIDKRLQDAESNAEQRYTARGKEADAARKETVAQAERARRDADIDADPQLTAAQKAQKKKESEATFQTAQKEAQSERDVAKGELSKLLSTEEKAAADKLAAKAQSEGARVKNPYALSTRAKAHAVKARRWKEVVTSFGMKVDLAPPPAETPEADAPTLKDLLGLARQFSAAEQPMALRVLRDPAVQASATIAAAVGEIRGEMRESLLKDLAQQAKGNELAVLTVADKRTLLAAEGIELPPGMPAATVAARFEEFLDAAVAGYQPDAAQQAAILKEMGVDLGGKPATQVYQEVLDKGQQAARQQVQGMGLPATRADSFSGLLRP
jgi:filamentous hemagglutinin family protein